MSHDLGLGQLITTTQNRDAVHVAVAPVTAGNALTPGQHVGLSKDGVASGEKTPWVGVVDPFLKNFVHKDQKFWLFLYPQTITSLRHDWSHPHPAFADAKPVESSSDDAKRKRDTQVRIAKAFMQDYARQLEVDVEELMEAAENFLVRGYVFSRGDKFESKSTDSEFWKYYEVIVGMKIPEDKKRNFFTCAC